MPSPTGHSLLSPSGAHRWLVCTMAPRFEEQFPSPGDTKYTAEGILAHSVCELYARQAFYGKMTKRQFNGALKKFQADESYAPEMLETAQAYVNYLTEKANGYSDKPNVFFEQRVDLSDWIPEGFGSCDCIMIGDDTLHITDYKHGVGVPVDAIGNPQMRLYALGALKMFQPIYGDAIKKVSMGICQPRLYDAAKEDSMTVQELLDWGETVKVKARQAYDGTGEFCPGDHCKFCRGKYQCPARAERNTALEDFAGCVTPDKAEGVTDPQARTVLGLPRMLTNDEIGDLLRRGENLVSWYNDLKEYAQKALLNGEAIAGWKLVEGKSNRVIDDVDGLIDDMLKAGYDRAVLYKTEPLTLTAYEKLVGKAKFAEQFGKRISKPKGKPTLAGADDPRDPWSSAAEDFKGVTADA
mgnify:CR=1 FL=1